MHNSQTRWGLRAVTCLSTLLIAVVFSGSARADVVYTFTGPAFTGSDGTADGLNDSESISGTLDFANDLGPEFNGINTPAPVEWSFTDGSHTLSSADGDTLTLDLETDSNDQINSWNLYIQSSTTQQIFDLNSGGGLTNDEILQDGVPNYELSSLLGTGSSWNPGPDGASFSSGAPEPSTMFLFGAGLLGLAFLPPLKRSL